MTAGHPSARQKKTVSRKRGLPAHIIRYAKMQELRTQRPRPQLGLPALWNLHTVTRQESQCLHPHSRYRPYPRQVHLLLLHHLHSEHRPIAASFEFETWPSKYLGRSLLFRKGRTARSSRDL